MPQENNTGLLLFGAAAALGLIALASTDTVQNYVADKTWDFISDQNINRLHPLIRQKARNFINDAESKGIRLRVVSGLRTFSEQADLYAIGCACGCSCGIGRTKPGSIVTNAKPGDSYHNYGLALDVVEIKDGQAIGAVICTRCGSIGYRKDYPYSRWQLIGSIGKKHGFEWGGDWTGFKDLPHFQMTFGKSVAQLLQIYKAGDLQDGYVRLAA